MVHRSFGVVLLVVLALALAACGGDDEPAADGGDGGGAAVLITTGCGEETVLELTDVPVEGTALQALDRVADIEAEGGFVTAIEGVEQNEDEQLAWLFYVNGAMAEKGAAEITTAEGDVQWWDLHDWEETCEVPADAQ